MPRYNLKWLWLCAFIPLAGCQWVQDWWNPQSDDQAFVLESEIDYTVSFQGEIPEQLEKQLYTVSFLESFQTKNPVMSLMALERRAEADRQNLREFLRNNGYLEAHVDYTIDTNVFPYRIAVTLSVGPRYTMSHITFHNSRNISPVSIQLSDVTSKIKIGEPLEASKIFSLQKDLTLFLASQGYPNVHVDEPWIEDNRVLKSVRVNIAYDPGDITQFGGHTIIGLDNLSASYINNRIRWAKGTLYNRDALEKTRQKLMDSGIFHSVIVQTPSPGISPTPVEIKVVEAPPRTIGMGLRYFSLEGLGAKIFWRHHNFFGGGEFVNTSLKISSLLKQLQLSLTLPDIGASEQQLLNSVSLTHEKTKAYLAKTIEVGAKLQRPLTEYVTGALGLMFEGGHVERAYEKVKERLWGLPFEIELDTTENALDPAQGWRIAYHFTPYLGRTGTENHMLISDLRGSGYFPFEDQSDLLTLAGWGHWGSIIMKDFKNVIPNKRFYAGGGNCVRAYGFQRLGPFGQDGLPLGGRSLIAGGVEGRYRMSESIGAALFVEGGALSTNRFPLSDMKFLWGYGVGVRYYTAIGPIRFDVAIPSHRRKVQGRSVDSPVQFYITIGQAF